MPFSQPPLAPCQWFSRLSSALDCRSAARLARLFLGAVLARGRRAVTSWIRAAGLSTEFRPCYTAVAAAGRRADRIAGRLAAAAVKPLVRGAGRLTLALDDTPTERYGRQVQGAGIHHNPARGPAGSQFVYGHVWVVLGLLAVHPAWGVVALPLLARLYVRAKDLPGIDPQHRPPFRTKLELAADLMRWAVGWLGHWGQALWVVADGAYAKAAFLRPVRSLGVTVVSRLRRDAALRTVPGPRPPGRRGRQRVYGERRVELAKRAGQRRGWATGTFDLYGETTAKRYKTFLATWRPAGGLIRVVLVDEPTGWVAYFCTDAAATVADILGCVADRFTLETAFRDCKEVIGAGQQQVRFVWASVGAFHLCLWTFTMTKAWSWRRSADRLVDRAASP
jgi:DDE superfamily endonuclease